MNELGKILKIFIPFILGIHCTLERYLTLKMKFQESQKNGLKFINVKISFIFGLKYLFIIQYL